MQQLKERCHLTWRFICTVCKTAYSTIMRWRRRNRTGQSVIMAPGPKKNPTIDVQALGEHIRTLDHGAHRTRGTGALYATVKDALSRRDLQERVAQARKDADRERRAALKHVEWVYPGVAWAIDDTQIGRDVRSGKRLFLNTLFDPSPRYILRSLMGYLATGKRIAGHLRTLFKRLGAPLILKRDGGGNLNHEVVDWLLMEYLVIPLNSPPHFPLYNGGIERAQRELKKTLFRRLRGRNAPMEALLGETEAAIYVANHTPRKVLQGATPCERLHVPGRKMSFTGTERRAILGDIADMAQAIYRRIADKTARGRATAQRLAIETWLKKEKLIIVTQGNGVLPNFSSPESHN